MNPAVLSASTNSVVITFIASILIWLMFIGLFVLWVIDGRVKKEQVLHALAACLFAWLVAEMIKGMFPTLRPFQMNGRVPLTLTIPGNSAFPSSHAAVAFALAFSLWLHEKKLGAMFVLTAVFVAFGRILSNVHSIIDIIGGAGIGCLVAYTIEKMHLYKLID